MRPRVSGIGVPVAELGPRRDAVGLARGMLEDIQRVEIDPHVLVLGNKGHRTVEAGVRHVEPAAHGEQMAHQDHAARIALRAPLGHRRRIVEPEVTLLHEHADQGGGDALALRPTDLRGVARESRCVALAHDPAAPDHRQRPGVLFGPHRGIERRVERRPVHAGLVGFLRAHVPERPVLFSGRREVPGHRHRREPDRVGAVLQDGASLIAVVLRRARRHVGRPDGGALRFHVHFPLEVVLPGPVVEGDDVVGEHGLRRALGHPADDEYPGTQMVRPDPGGVLAEAAVVRFFGGLHSSAASGKDRERARKSQKSTPLPWFRHRASLPQVRFYGTLTVSPRCRRRRRGSRKRWRSGRGRTRPGSGRAGRSPHHGTGSPSWFAP